MSGLAILNARLVDAQSGRITEGGLLCVDRVISAIGEIDVPAGAEVIDACGKLVAPGFIDMGVFAADGRSCAAGGITRVALMPDQSPPLDDPATVARAAAMGKPGVWIHPLAAATAGLTGSELAEIGLMKAEGAVAVSTGRGWIADSGVMHRLLSYASAFDLLVVSHPEDAGLIGDAVATSGETATRLGLSAAPAAAEAMAVSRDIALAEETGARLHFRQLTTARAFDLLRAARKRGVRVTCGVTPAHLLLSETAIGAFRTFARLSPPLRSENDRAATLAAIKDGAIDVISSGHDPKGPDAKRLPYAYAEAGMIGAETLLALALTLVRDELVTLPRLMAMLSATPAALLGVPGGTLAIGEPADLVVFDADAPWRINGDRLAASAGNTPFDGLPVQGKVIQTIKGGVPLLK